jgi:hypothetical protein
MKKKKRRRRKKKKSLSVLLLMYTGQHSTEELQVRIHAPE